MHLRLKDAYAETQYRNRKCPPRRLRESQPILIGVSVWQLTASSLKFLTLASTLLTDLVDVSARFQMLFVSWILRVLESGVTSIMVLILPYVILLGILFRQLTIPEFLRTGTR